MEESRGFKFWLQCHILHIVIVSVDHVPRLPPKVVRFDGKEKINGVVIHDSGGAPQMPKGLPLPPSKGTIVNHLQCSELVCTGRTNQVHCCAVLKPVQAVGRHGIIKFDPNIAVGRVSGGQESHMLLACAI